MSLSNKVMLTKAFTVMTSFTTVLSLSGVAYLAPVASAVTPADYGLTEGNTISADGSPTDVNYDPDIYIVNDWGYKRLFLNPVIFSFYGHLGGFAAVKKVSPATRDAFGTSGLFRNCETNDQKVYGVEVTAEDSGILHWVNTTGAQAVIDDPNFFRKVFCINNNEFAWYPQGAAYTSVNQVPSYNRGTATSPTPTPSSTGLNGGAGALANSDFIASLDNEDVGEGEDDVAVAGLDLEADDGSDLRVLSVRVSFEEQAVGGSTDFDEYADEVSLWFDGAKVAEMDVADLNTDDDDSDGEEEWSASLTLTGSAIVRMSQTEELRVAVSAIGNIDSEDLGSEDNGWDVTIESVRYVDAQGAITTETALDDIGTETTDFQFVSFASSADLELNLNEASDNPEGRVVDVDDTDDTNDVVLLSAELEATGSDILVEDMTVTVATTGATFDAMVQSIMLEFDGVVVQTLSSTDCTNATITSCVFNAVDETVNEDDTVKVRVLVDVDGTDAYASGSTLLATVANSATVAEDSNGDNLATSDKTGTANGEAQALYDAGIMVSFVSATESTQTVDGTNSVGTFTIKFDVTAFDTDAYLNSGTNADGCVRNDDQSAAGEGSSFVVTGSTSYLSCEITSSEATEDTTLDTYQVLEGATNEFTLTVVTEGDDSLVSVALEAINWSDEDVASSSFNVYYTFNLDEFETDSVFLSDGI